MNLPSEATQTCQIIMSSSQSSSRSPGEESYFTAEEDDHSVQAPTVAESTVIATPNGSSDSLYTTAHQTPIASPSMSRGIVSSIPITVQNQNSSEALRGVEKSRVERRELAPSTVTAAPRGSSFSHRDKASTQLEKQKASVTQQAKVREPEIDLVEYGIPGAIPENEDDTPGKLAFPVSLSAKHSLVNLLDNHCNDASS